MVSARGKGQGGSGGGHIWRFLNDVTQNCGRAEVKNTRAVWAAGVIEKTAMTSHCICCTGSMLFHLL